MISLLFSSLVVLGLSLSGSHALPLSGERADGPHDVRWRLQTGMATTHLYVRKLVSNSLHKSQSPCTVLCMRCLDMHEYAQQHNLMFHFNAAMYSFLYAGKTVLQT